MKKVLMAAMVLLSFVLGFYVASISKFDISDITADNAMNKLTVDHSRSIEVEGNCLRNIFENSALFIETKRILPNQNFSIEKKEINAGELYQITNNNNSNIYTFRFLSDRSDIMDYLSIQNSIRQDNTGLTVMPIFSGKSMVDKLVYEEGFALEVSDRKNFYDILIKDVGNDFLIGKVYWMGDAQNEVQILEFELYSKWKFHFF